MYSFLFMADQLAFSSDNVMQRQLVTFSYVQLPVANFFCSLDIHIAALGGLVVSVLATGPTGLAAAGSGPAEDGAVLWVRTIRRAHFLRRGSKAVGPMSYIYGM
jgi:hypothetical protein